MPSPSQRLGTKAEALAERILVQRGWQALGRHVISRYGELDLVMFDGEALVAVEVKCRRSSRFGSAEESITARKFNKLAAALETYRADHPEWLGFAYRIDVVIIDGVKNRLANHLRGVNVESNMTKIS